MNGNKHKPAYHLLAWEVIEDMARVMEKNVAGHGRDNWKQVPHEDHLRAIIGHWVEHSKGVDKDHEDGEHPLIHLACRAMFAAWQELHGTVSENATVSALAEKAEESESEELEWICRMCGEKYCTNVRKAEVSYYHLGVCDICGVYSPTTEPRDFGGLKKDWRELREKERGKS